MLKCHYKQQWHIDYLVENNNMKYWCITYPTEEGDITETLSEDDIFDRYYPEWSKKMIDKYGAFEFAKKFTKEDCITDWVVINWAMETDE